MCREAGGGGGKRPLPLAAEPGRDEEGGEPSAELCFLRELLGERETLPIERPGNTADEGRDALDENAPLVAFSRGCGESR